MILIFNKECPMGNNGKSYKQGQKVVISDAELGARYIKEGYATRIDIEPKKLSKYKRDQVKKSEEEKGGNE